MGLRSRNKGKRGEREAAAALRDYFGVDARRGQQFAGSADSPDVKCDHLPFHIEVKRCERLQLRAALEQVKNDASPEQIPLVLHKWNRGEWIAILPLAQLARAMELAHEHARTD